MKGKNKMITKENAVLIARNVIIRMVIGIALGLLAKFAFTL